MLITIIIMGIIALILMSKRSKEFLHILQLEGYSTEEYQEWIKNNKKRLYSLKKQEKEFKKPLVFTNRAKRLYTMNLIMNLILILLFLFKSRNFLVKTPIYIFPMLVIILGVLFTVLYLFQHFIMGIASLTIKPLEGKINMKFYRQAQNKINSRNDLQVIGVTGSFGKTSTKFILGTILEEKFKVLNTPESYNTPMGLSMVINNQLSHDHEVFIAELGARNIGDIKEVSELVKPKIGVITSIGPTHIETFKNIDNIMKTKYELVEELPTDGIAVYNYDNEYIKKLADKTFKEKILYGLDNIEDLDLYGENIQVSEFGSTFTIKDKEGNAVDCKTKLLGKHNIYNILAAVAVAKSLGLSFEEIKSGIGKIQPIPHRLDIIKSESGIIIIDDAFNSNPIGAKAALDVISEFKEGKKIIVTPGMVELGTMEEEANKEFGINIGKVCDYVILIGENRTKPIYEGLMEVNYNEDNIYIVKDLKEATEYVQKLARPKDIVLFENDLPDNYS